MAETLYKVEGMSCDHCVQSLASALRAVTGVQAAEVSLDDASARVRFDDDGVNEKALIDSIRGAGFQVAGFSRVG